LTISSVIQISRRITLQMKSSLNTLNNKGF
jgi:hypothetical protein